MIKFAHFNFNVLDLEKSQQFYEEALNLHVAREIDTKDFTIRYMQEKYSDFELELTWLKERTERYDLGECEFHLAFVTDEFDALYKKHQQMGCVCFENPAMGIYFIEDPDGYWIEIVPAKRKEKNI